MGTRDRSKVLQFMAIATVFNQPEKSDHPIYRPELDPETETYRERELQVYL